MAGPLKPPNPPPEWVAVFIIDREALKRVHERHRIGSVATASRDGYDIGDIWRQLRNHRQSAGLTDATDESPSGLRIDSKSAPR